MSATYEEIFGEVKDLSDLRHAIARAVRELRAAMAYSLAEKTCTYWPTPGQIRDLAGWSEENKGRAALQWVFSYLEKHGVEGRARGGGVRFGEDGTGRRVLLETEPVIAPPPLPVDIEDALTSLGCGSAKQGLRYLSQHPVVKGWDSFRDDAGAKTAERLERQWIRCYLHAMEKTFHHPPVRRTP
jgi:hypothetical protein